MADGEDGEREVLTSLPRSRPVRRSAKRGGRTRAEGDESTPAAGRASPPSRRKAATSGGGKSAANATRKAATKPARSASTAKAARKPRARTEEAQPRVLPQRKVPPAGYAAPSSADGDSPPGATEILMTAIQAATELAQIGISVGRQALRSALERVPKP